MISKRCPSCGITKLIDEFHKNKAARDGHASDCKECAILRVRKWHVAKMEIKRQLYPPSEPKHQVVDGVQKKRCPKCEEMKSITEFDKNKNSYDGVQTYCHTCCKIMRKVYWRKSHPHPKMEGHYLYDDNNQITHKLCADCKILKPVSEFNHKKDSSDGLISYCRTCLSIRKKSLWRKYHPHPISEGRYLYDDTNKITHKLCPQCKTMKEASAFSTDNRRPGKLSAYCIECDIVIYNQNKDRISALTKERYGKNGEVIRERTRARRAAKRNSLATLDDKQWLWLLGICNHTCIVPGCGKPAKHQDHVLPLDPGTHTLDNTQPLCEYHNLKKHRTYIDYRSESLKRKIRKYMRSLGLTPLTKRQWDKLIADFYKEPSLQKRQSRPRIVIQPLFA